MLDLYEDVVVVVSLPPRSPAFGTVLPQTTDVVVLPVPGPPGKQGEPGLSASETFTHVQSSPAASWLITHPANRPIASLSVLIGGEEVIADVSHSGPTATVVFATPVSGLARFL